MLWIKRNLFLVAGGLLALGLTGFGGYYLFSSIKKNKDVEVSLEEKRETLERLYKQDPFPNATNIAAAKRESQRVAEFVKETQKSFTPVPYENVTGLAFKTLLENSIYDLHKKAGQSGVILRDGEKYSFSFQAQRDSLNISPSSFPALPLQLAEVKTICNLLFDAKINALDSLQRGRVSPDDPAGSPDYHEQSAETNASTGAVSSQYRLSFRCFSSDLASALENFYKSPHGFIVKAISVDLAASGGADGGGGPPPGFGPPGVFRREEVPPPRRLPGPGKDGAPPPGFSRPPYGQPQPGLARPPGAPAAAPGGLQTVLNEKPLSITMILDVVKSFK